MKTQQLQAARLRHRLPYLERLLPRRGIGYRDRSGSQKHGAKKTSFNSNLKRRRNRNNNQIDVIITVTKHKVGNHQRN